MSTLRVMQIVYGIVCFVAGIIFIYVGIKGKNW